MNYVHFNYQVLIRLTPRLKSDKLSGIICIWRWSSKISVNYSLCQMSSDCKMPFNIISYLLCLERLPTDRFQHCGDLKTYLRNNIGQDRLTRLALMSIYWNDDIDIDEVIKRFARLPRKFKFCIYNNTCFYVTQLLS